MENMPVAFRRPQDGDGGRPCAGTRRGEAAVDAVANDLVTVLRQPAGLGRRHGDAGHRGLAVRRSPASPTGSPRSFRRPGLPPRRLPPLSCPSVPDPACAAMVAPEVVRPDGQSLTGDALYCQTEKGRVGPDRTPHFGRLRSRRIQRDRPGRSHPRQSRQPGSGWQARPAAWHRPRHRAGRRQRPRLPADAGSARAFLSERRENSSECHWPPGATVDGGPGGIPARGGASPRRDGQDGGRAAILGPAGEGRREVADGSWKVPASA